MAVIFPRWTNKIPLLLGAVGPVAAACVIGAVWYWASPAYTDVGYQPTQPIPFSHRLHAGTLGMDCRYCHNTVERTGHAAIPPTETCMNCHAVIHKESAKLAVARESYASGEAISWTKVHMLPDYAYFDHSVHVAAGVGCQSCHGRIDQMDVVKQAKPLSMGWCIDCHRNPTPHLRPTEMVTAMGWDARKENYDPHKDPSRTRQVYPPLNCSGCHR